MRAEQIRWQIVGMLFLFMLINFLDKAVIGLAGVPIMKELKLTHLEFGAINSAFFYLFSISAIFTGFLANRIQSRWILFCMALVWAVSQLPMFAAVGTATLMASRVALGAGEGPAYPVAVHAVHKWFPDRQRALPAAIIGQGANIGIVFVLPLLNIMLVAWSWHVAFGVLGLAALVWAGLWLIVGKEGEGDTIQPGAPVSGMRVPYTALLFNRTTIGNWVGGFGAYWSLSLLVAWFAPYLVQGLGIPQANVGFLNAMPWAASIVATLFGSWLSQYLAQRGHPSRVTRGVLAGGFVAAGGASLAALAIAPTPLKLPLLIVGLSLPSLIYALGTAVAGEIAPPAQRGALLAIGSAVATSAGLIAPLVMGKMIDNGAGAAHGYETGFVLNGVITLVAGTITMLCVDPQHTRDRLFGTTTPTQDTVTVAPLA